MGQQVQRLAAYAVIVRGDRILLSRLAERVTKHELWTLPGGGVDHGEDPRAAVVREIYEETGLHAEVGETAHVFSMHLSDTWRRGRRVDAHSVRMVYDGWVASDAPDPRVVEIDGSTADAAWQPIADVLDGSRADGRAGDRSPRRAPAAPAAAGRGLRLCRARRRAAAHPQLRARAPSRGLDAARRRDRPRRVAGRRRCCASCTRSAGSTASSATC